ncbi:MAG: hypothetical protein ACKOX6_11875 [Bdellovibrio sp.]
MKSLVLVLSLVAASSSFASEGDTTFLAWCEQNNVMVQDSKTQQVKVLVNCTEAQKTCKAVTIYREMGTIVTAACK